MPRAEESKPMAEPVELASLEGAPTRLPVLIRRRPSEVPPVLERRDVLTLAVDETHDGTLSPLPSYCQGAVKASARRTTTSKLNYVFEHMRWVSEPLVGDLPVLYAAPHGPGL
jgi:hypothetical protein